MKKIKNKKHRRKDLPFQQEFSGPLPDRRLMERQIAEVHRLLEDRNFSSIKEANAFLEDYFRSNQPLTSPAPRTPLEEAQNLVYEALEKEASAERIRLAQDAIRISPDCADAYVLLAEEWSWDLQKTRRYYELGMEAGERVLGAETFLEDAGHFWGRLETRPYMRARLGLAETLWSLRRRKEAIDHLWDMLRLNPGDNQGIRYALVHWLFEENREKELAELLERYPEEPTATWSFTRALLSFRREGASERANRELKNALKVNRFVMPYLLGKKGPPLEFPPSIGFGDETEACDYVLGALWSWRSTEGAMDWLATVGRA